MNSVSQECQELKFSYDACFNKWFREHFLRGNSDASVCSEIFADYQKCVKVGTG
ncbi:hypothetical protein HELRODRAFT_84764 [Helobdella robusta]|uniref:TP53-regulated inhibitor of apoptosis 1 n=1 Tax=Helobdella robusta TaxID=6412 RepID=T1G5N4_HELRO|nr:hypothetical protein HELRODRAFT_84764 [Helobdella robusta]ESN98360.1 hypothetical protein HELRODRAFT_84764 [Helobdella robusta]